MSAFVVGNEHIDALLTAGLFADAWADVLTWHIHEEPVETDYSRGDLWGPTHLKNIKQRRRTLTRETADAVGGMLLAENIRSVNHRYDETTDDAPGVYAFQALPGEPDPIVVLKAISCFEYQSCECPDWEASEAHAFCEALRDRMISRLPGYDTAPGWSIEDRNVFLARKVVA